MEISNDCQRFDNWFTCNYNHLRGYCKRYRIPQDTMHDVYANIKQRIIVSGYTDSTFMTYYKRSLVNQNINNQKSKSRRHFVDFDNQDYEKTIEDKLIFENEMELDTQLFREQTIYLSKMMFKYIDYKQYTEEEKFIFRCYFLMENRFTYEKLNEMTGINKNRCTAVIQRFKKDIRTGFLQWLKKENHE